MTAARRGQREPDASAGREAGATGGRKAGATEERERGAALVEALVAAAILALALLPLGQSLTMAVQAVRAGGRHLQAAALGETVAAQARRDAATDFATFLASGTTVVEDGGFRARRTVSAPPGVPAGTALVEVAVSDGGGGADLLTLRFLVHPEGF